MVVDWMAQILIGIFTGVLGLLPSYTLPASLTDLGSTAGSTVATLNGILPVVTLGICLAAVVVARLFIAGVALVAWVYAKIPLKFT